MVIMSENYKQFMNIICEILLNYNIFFCLFKNRLEVFSRNGVTTKRKIDVMGKSDKYSNEVKSNGATSLVDSKHSQKL